MPQSPAQTVLDTVISTARRALGSRPSRVASVQLGPLPGADFKTTTGYDARQNRMRRIEMLADSLGQDPWEQTRLQRYRDYREMVEEVPELARALEVYVDMIFGDPESSYEIAFAESARPEVVRIIQNAEADLKLQVEIRKIIHEGLWLGDSFSELIYGDAPLRLVGEKSSPPERVRVLEDELGRVAIYRVDSGNASDRPRELAPFQVVHYASSPVRGAKYGRSLFHSARYLRRHHDVFSDVTAMLCLKKASGDTYLLWPMPDNIDEQAVQDHIRELQESVDTEVYFEPSGQLRRKAAASLDTVPKTMPYRVMTGDQGQVFADIKPTVVETRPADLKQMVEVLKYLQDRFFIATGVPKALVGLERDVNARATLEVQGLNFAISVRTKQRDAAFVLSDIFTRALLVSGITPIEGEFVIKMPATSSFDEAMKADVFSKRAQGVAMLVQAGVPLRQALRDGFDYDEATLDRLADAVDAGDVSVATAVAAVEAAARDGLRVMIDGAARHMVRENQPA